MASTNSSYVKDYNDASNEIWEILDRSHIHDLLAEESDEVVSNIDSLISADQVGRLNRALNWGKNYIQTALTEAYNLSAVDNTNAPELLKVLNCRLAQWWLERRRYRTVEETSESLEEIKAELAELASEKSHLTIPELTKRTGFFITSVDSKATQFDKADQFNVPEREQDDVWPDGANQPV